MTIVLLLPVRNRIHNSKHSFRQHPLTNNTTPPSRPSEPSGETTCTRRTPPSQTQTRHLWLERGQPTSHSSTRLRPSNSHCGIKLKANLGTVRKARMALTREKRSTLLRQKSRPGYASASQRGGRRAETLLVLRTATAPHQGTKQTPTRCTGHSTSNDYKSSKATSIRKANHAYWQALSMQQCTPVPKGTAMRETAELSALQPPSWRLPPSLLANPHCSSTLRWTPSRHRQAVVRLPTLDYSNRGTH